jgi:hypothetical protein
LYTVSAKPLYAVAVKEPSRPMTTNERAAPAPAIKILPGSAPIRDTEKTSDAMLRAYKELRWPEAARLGHAALDGGRLSTSDRFEAWFLLGAMAYQTGDLEQARSCFANAKELEGAAVPSNDLFPPPVLEFYRRMMARQEAISSSPR